MALTSTGGSGWAMSDKVPPRVWACACAGAAAMKAARANQYPLRRVRRARRAADCMMKTSSDAAAGGRWGRWGRRGNSATHRLRGPPLLQKEREGRGHTRHAGQGHCFVDAMDVARLGPVAGHRAVEHQAEMARVGGGRGGHPCQKAAMHLLVRSGQHLQRGLVEIEAAA